MSIEKEIKEIESKYGSLEESNKLLGTEVSELKVENQELKDDLAAANKKLNKYSKGPMQCYLVDGYTNVQNEIAPCLNSVFLTDADISCKYLEEDNWWSIEADYQKFNTALSSSRRDYNGPDSPLLVINREGEWMKHYKRPWEDKTKHGMAVEQGNALASITRRSWSNAKIGFYDIPFGAYEFDGQTVSKEEAMNIMRPLMLWCDWFGPSMYVQKIGLPFTHEQQSKMDICRSFQKEKSNKILPWVWHRFDPKSSNPEGLMPENTFRQYLETLIELGADGFIWFNTDVKITNLAIKGQKDFLPGTSPNQPDPIGEVNKVAETYASIISEVLNA